MMVSLYRAGTQCKSGLSLDCPKGYSLKLAEQGYI